MFKKMYEGFKTLPPWAKGIIAVGGAAVTVYAGLKIYKGIKNAIEKGKAQKSIANVGKERSELENQGQSATYADSQYKGWASDLETQFAGCDVSEPIPGLSFSNSGQKLYNILNGFKNNVDFLKLVEAWGIRTYDACGWGTGDITNVNLYGAVSDELANGEIAMINTMLKKKGITYTF